MPAQEDKKCAVLCARQTSRALFLKRARFTRMHVRQVTINRFLKEVFEI